MELGKSNSKWEIYSDIGLSQEKKSQINNLIYHLKELEKEEQTKPKGRRRKKTIKTREEINKTETKNNRKDQ